MAQVNGNCATRFERVRSLFQEFLETGDEIGASIAVNVNGDDVVNLWGGYADKNRTRLWTRDTIVPIASTTKMISSLAVLMLVDNGAISVYDKVCQYWPEFAANGKENIEIRHLLSQTSGVAGWDDKITMEEVCDVALSTAKLAKQAPWWEPGTASAYHAWNFGHLLGEIVRRVTGLSLKQFVAEKIAGPLGVDFQIGALEKDWHRISEFITAPTSAPPPNYKPGRLFLKAIGNPHMSPGMGSSPAWRNGEIGASNGYSNAYALNKILSNITLAGTENVDEHKPLLSKSTVDLIFEEQSNGIDLAIGLPIRFGIGYALTGDGNSWVDEWLPAGRTAYWGGSGGSLGIMDVGRRVTISYAMNVRSNSLIGNKASRAYIKAIYEAIGVKSD